MVHLNTNGDVHIGTDVQYVNLTDLGNNYQLLPLKLVSMYMDLDAEENSQFVKQRMNKWFVLRKEARVTGIT